MSLVHTVACFSRVPVAAVLKILLAMMVHVALLVQWVS